MIKRIDKIKNYRIFRDFKWDSNIPEFGQYNLIFGLNGSGKTTLCSVFDCLYYKNSNDCPDGEFLITTENQTISNLNISNCNINLYVFDEKFINQNLAEFSDLKGIVYISDKNIELKKQLDSYKGEFKKIIKERDICEEEYNKANKELETSLSLAAKNIKEEFHVIGGIGNRLSNYNKTNIQYDISVFSDYLNKEIDSVSIKTTISSLKELLKDEIKPIINKIDISKEDIASLIENTKQLLNKNFKEAIASNLGEKLFNWLYEGFTLHENNICKYCGNLISVERQNELKSLFNNELQNYKKELQETITKYNNSFIFLNQINITDFYKNNLDKFKLLYDDCQLKIKVFNESITSILKALNNKLLNPYEMIKFEPNYNAIFEDYETIFLTIEELNKIIEENNVTTNNFTMTQNNALEELRKLFLYENYNKLQIKKKHNELNELGKRTLDFKTQLDILNENISKIEMDLVDVIKAGNNFNILLTQFLGRNEIELKFDEKTKGYKIIRKENNMAATNLSEGEKTAIAFIYFLTKVKENGNQMNNSIIVFDDPITSMDSNHIFNAYAFITSYFDNAEQLFILTHNFTFFKLMRKHFGDEKKADKNMYFIKNKFTQIQNKQVRTAAIIKLPKSIKQASSEYPYLLNTMIEFNKSFTNGEQLELNDYLSIANTCRKVLESFCSFKVPHLTNNFRNAIIELYKCNKTEDYELTEDEILQCERIYKFVNAFSHNNSYFNDEDNNSLLGESTNIISEILNLIKSCDENHYKGILKQIDNL